MSHIEFMEFIPTPTEKHLGVATVKVSVKEESGGIFTIYLRYKIMQMKDSAGIFPTAASYKIVEDSTERYVPAFMLDSNYDKERMETLIKGFVKKAMSNAPISHSKGPSVKDFGVVYAQDQSNENMPF